MSQPGLFITLEGGEGAGKTTQQALLLRRLRAAGVRVQSTREPGATPLGVEIRALLIELSNESPAPTTELLLYLADRAQHVANLVRPLLADGVWVVCDRFADSSEVYQGRARGLGWERVRELNRWVCGPVWPDLTLVLDLDPALGLKRVLQRQGELGLVPDRLENEGLAFHRRVRQGFRDQVAAEPERVKLVDASPSAEVVAEAIWALVEPLVRAWRESSGAA
ncbi:MAG: dTMP kinase [Desulfarculus sp.]|nr:dTMP kinase [Desulfarculus sp.]